MRPEDAASLLRRLKRVSQSDQASRQPHMLLTDLQAWTEPYMTPDEAREVNEILANIERFPFGTDEYAVGCLRFQEIWREALMRAVGDDLKNWPAVAREHEGEWRDYVAYLQEHPLVFVQKGVAPSERNSVAVSYYYGFLPVRLIVPVGTCVSFLNRDESTVQPHHVRCEAAKLDAAIQGDQSFSFKFTEAGLFHVRCWHDKKSKCSLGGDIIVLAPGQTVADVEAEYQQSLKVQRL